MVVSRPPKRLDCLFAERDHTDCDCGVLTRMRHMNAVNRYGGRRDFDPLTTMKLEYFLTAITHVLTHDDFTAKYEPLSVHLVAATQATKKKPLHCLVLDFGRQNFHFPGPDLSLEQQLDRLVKHLQKSLLARLMNVIRRGRRRISILPPLAWTVQGSNKDGPYSYNFLPEYQGKFGGLDAFGGINLKIDLN